MDEKRTIICGMDFAGSEVRLVLLSGGKSDFSHLDITPRKIKLSDDEDEMEVRAFRDSLFTFLYENKVALIAIKKRRKKGEFAGGAVGFKLEAITQLYESCSIILLAPATISAIVKKKNPSFPDTVFKYQHAAFETAFAAMK